MPVASMKRDKMVHKLLVEEKRKDNVQTILCRSEFKLFLVAVCKIRQNEVDSALLS